MIRDALFTGDALPTVRKGMDVSRLRHRVTAENVANALTPGYRSKRVAFEEYLERADSMLSASRTHRAHLSAGGSPIGAVEPRVRAGDDPLLPNGINTIDVEREMAVLGWNRTTYSALTRFASRQYRMLGEATRMSGV